MSFSFTAFTTTILAVIMSAVVSVMEGTFTDKKITMGFVNHGGMWSDLVIMSVAVGFLFPAIRKHWTCFLTAILPALAITALAHAQWAKLGREHAVTEHMFPTHTTGVWYLDISWAGWMHVVVMAGLLTITLMYAISPVAPQIVITVSILLTLHVCVGTLQPGWYCTGTTWTWRHFGPFLLSAGVIWTIAVLKLRLELPRLC